MANDARIEVVGVRELRKALKDVGDGAPKELAVGLAEASQIVVDAARPKVPVRSGRAAASIKVRRQSAAAAIAVGGSAAPYFPWLDFGGTVGRHKTVRRPFIVGGRYIYPSLKERDAQVKAKVDEVIKRLAVTAGFETTGDATSG